LLEWHDLSGLSLTIRFSGCPSGDNPSRSPEAYGTTTARGIWEFTMARILIMDDEDSFRIALRQLLESWGHEVIEAHDGLEGLARYREAPMDLVITDTIMPGQDGLDTILALRREFQARAIVAMTGSQIAARDLLDLAKTMGAHRTLVKPLGWRSLYPLVWPALQQAVQELLASG
jgi:two-component system chemotaxis response regulator CheY